MTQSSYSFINTTKNVWLKVKKTAENDAEETRKKQEEDDKLIAQAYYATHN